MIPTSYIVYISTDLFGMDTHKQSLIIHFFPLRVFDRQHSSQLSLLVRRTYAIESTVHHNQVDWTYKYYFRKEIVTCLFTSRPLWTWTIYPFSNNPIQYTQVRSELILCVCVRPTLRQVEVDRIVNGTARKYDFQLYRLEVNRLLLSCGKYIVRVHWTLVRMNEKMRKKNFVR